LQGFCGFLPEELLETQYRARKFLRMRKALLERLVSRYRGSFFPWRFPESARMKRPQCLLDRALQWNQAKIKA
jgi:hypothetical protein